ncbi:amidase signature domain-containing protein [Lophiotrema nucula]|uniref:Amidase signature domain-containing protein n=1 Tax=Lophiotrema nucula TaxID=690887 RepID=A0A6A5ZQ85_9PLEO|nr:amidase signature domain-containing protein [Lophiotrema nucula]
MPRLKLSEATIVDLLEALDKRRTTSTELTYIARINGVNAKVHAISQINPDVIEIAQQRDAERENGTQVGLLHGVPIALKDVFSTTDRMHTTAGFSGLLGAKSRKEAFTVRKLREQGAIILGKTSMTEWLNFRSPGIAPNGWSPTGGQCLGIFCENQDAGGSSTGSGVAVALGLSAAALGTENSGSIATPARSCGIVGLKPTVGLTSRSGVFIAGELQDSVGILSKNVMDASIVLTAIAGFDGDDPYAHGDPRDTNSTIRIPDGTDFRQYCQAGGLEGMRVAIARHIMNRDPYATAKFDEAVEVMKQLGATIVDNAQYPAWDLDVSKKHGEAWKLAIRLHLRHNVKSFLDSFETNPNDLHTLEDVMAYTSQTPWEQIEDFKMTEFDKSQELASEYSQDSDEYQDSLSLRLAMGTELAKLLDETRCDVLIAPAWTETAANIGGCPQISVPLQAYPSDAPLKRLPSGQIGNGPNIPTGILFVGRRWDDAKVITAAFAFEHETRHRTEHRPIYSPNVDIDDLIAKM